MRMIATRLRSYAGKPVKEGDEIEVEDERAIRTLTIAQLAIPAEGALQNAEAQTYDTRALTARGEKKRTTKQIH